MRVLCISTDYPPPAAGGYELQCQDFVAYLRRRGHEPTVLTGRSADATDGDRSVRRTLPRFSVSPQPVPLARACRGELRSAIALRRALRARPDAVCFWRLGELSMSLVERVRRARVPAVGMVCDPWMIEGPRRDPWCARRSPRFEGAAQWLFVSDALRLQVAAAGIAVEEAPVVPWGVDLGRLTVAPERPWSGRLLYVGRLSHLKGVDVAIRALARLDGETLDVLGAGPDESRLRALATAVGAGARVRFHGWRGRDQVAAAYAAADVVLVPARWQEPFGGAPLEALARGTPVISTATGGMSDFLHHERTALVVPRDDPGAIAAAVMRLRGDPELRRRLRSAGRAEAERYPAERSHERLCEALEAAARRRNPRSRST
jgi:glycosyltransferase involved in cell wall biosynthesis